MRALTINAGSSSIRLAVLEESGQGLACTAEYHHAEPPTHAEASLREFLAQHPASVDVVAHRVVHGGSKLVEACRIASAVEAEIQRLVPLAPLHNTPALAWLDASRKVLGADVPQVAVFDTAFYTALPAVASGYALPQELKGSFPLRRFGFHGLAHEGMLRRWRELQPHAPADARVISLQLGAGCSITASRGGKPVDTSMGFSPLEGLVMATRCGDVDAGLLLHLQRQLQLAPDELQRLLNMRAGLLGVSGISSDMRVLLASDAPEAQLAVELYCYRARKYIGAYMAVLGGVDAVLFGGGVGENAPAIRARILEGLQWAGIHVAPESNTAAIGKDARLDAGHPGAEVWAVRVDEATSLARQALQVIRQSAREHSHG